MVPADARFSFFWVGVRRGKGGWVVQAAGVRSVSPMGSVSTVTLWSSAGTGLACVSILQFVRRPLKMCARKRARKKIQV